MKYFVLLIAILMLAFFTPTQAQTRGANRSTAFHVNPNTHAHRKVPHSVTRKHGGHAKHVSPARKSGSKSAGRKRK